MSTLNTSLILASHPVTYPLPGIDLKLSTTQIDLSVPPPQGGLLLKTNYLSYDPFLRNKMKPSSSPYSASFILNEPIYNAGISTVISSSSPRYVPGDVVFGNVPFSAYNIISAEDASKIGSADGLDRGFKKLENPLGLDPALFLGPLGMPGLTAYSAVYGLTELKKGDVVFVSAASGAVGQLQGQLAKREGCKVIGSVGSQKKLDYLIQELGFDGGFNYKAENSLEALKRILSELEETEISIYFDQVGGEQLDSVLELMKVKGKVFSSGHISQSSIPIGHKYGVQNLHLVPGKRIVYQGYLVSDEEMGPKHSAEHQRNVQKWLSSGEIKASLDITQGWEKSAEGFVGMLKGDNFGKAVLQIAEL